MEFFRFRFAYPLVITCLVISIILQLVWLTQIYNAQELKLKEDLNSAIGNAAKETIYSSIVQETYPGSAYRKFFLSKEWLDLRLAFDNAHLNGYKNFSFDIARDSAAINLSFHLYSTPGHVRSPKAVVQIIPNMLANEQFSRKILKHNIDSMLITFHVNPGYYFQLFDYKTQRLILSDFPVSNPKPAFTSALYSYNLLHLGKYRLLIDSLGQAVLYRMRFYIISSLLMILLTGTTFYFILWLLSSQRLYAEARLAFTSNMTHELKTPVATVALALESITKYNLSNDPGKLNEYLDISRHELHRLNLMIDKVLNMDQSEQGNVAITRELYDVQTGISAVISNLQPLTEQNNATITFLRADEPCFVNGDPVHLNNVFYNLMENALKYGGDGTVVEISYFVQDGRVVISFQDNGPGISPIYQKRVFDRFYRVQAKENIHNIKGTGLGLYYVKQILVKHMGSITLKSEPGKGSLFVISLPAAA
jgi:signal transduction histidine kinase